MVKPKRRPSDTKEARLARWHKQRDAERRFLLEAGYDARQFGGHTFVKAWMLELIEVSWKVKEGKNVS